MGTWKRARTPVRLAYRCFGALAVLVGLASVLVDSMRAGDRWGWLALAPVPSLALALAGTSLLLRDAPRGVGRPLARLVAWVLGALSPIFLLPGFPELTGVAAPPSVPRGAGVVLFLAFAGTAIALAAPRRGRSAPPALIGGMTAFVLAWFLAFERLSGLRPLLPFGGCLALLGVAGALLAREVAFRRELWRREATLTGGRLLPHALLMLLGLGALGLVGHVLGPFDVEAGLPLTIAASAVALILLAFAHADTVRRADTTRRAVGLALQRAHVRLEQGVAERTRELTHAVSDLEREATKRRDAEALLRKLSRAIEHSADLVLITDVEGVIEYVNPAFEAHTGYPLAELRGRTPRVLRSGVHEPAVHQAMWRTIRAGGIHRGVFVNRKQDGTHYHEEKSIAPILDDHGAITHFVSTGHDITERLRLEEGLRKSQKIEAVGRLAGGVAHDFNNVLTVVLGNANLAHRKLPPDDPVRSNVDEIVKAAESAAALTRQLLTFSRQRVVESKPLDLNVVLENVERMLRRVIGADVDVLLVRASRGVVRGDPGQMEQIVMNLALNARDAMPAGGRLTLETADVVLDAGALPEGSAATPGRHVLLAVTDDGTGMPAEVRSRIFEPFFTTKATGTGLGLATVQRIVSEGQGHIEVHSERGHGTCIKVYLPAVDAEAEAPEGGDASPARLEGTETLLLVEDDRRIRSALADALRLYGYTVLDAGDGAEALSLYASVEGRVQLVISDVVMPFVGGSELSQRLAALGDVPVLLISGFTDRALLHQGERAARSQFLQKPFSPETLARKVREMLDPPLAQAA